MLLERDYRFHTFFSQVKTQSLQLLHERVIFNIHIPVKK